MRGLDSSSTLALNCFDYPVGRQTEGPYSNWERMFPIWGFEGIVEAAFESLHTHPHVSWCNDDMRCVVLNSVGIDDKYAVLWK